MIHSSSRRTTCALALGSTLLLGACSSASDGADSSAPASTTAPASRGTGGDLDCADVTPQQVKDWVGITGRSRDLDDRCWVSFDSDAPDHNTTAGSFQISWYLEDKGTSVEQALQDEDLAPDDEDVSTRTLADGTTATAVESTPDNGLSTGAVTLLVPVDGARTLRVTAYDPGDGPLQEMHTLADHIAEVYTA